MDNNDLLRRLRYALQLDDSETVRIVVLGGGIVTVDQAARWRLTDSDPQFLACDEASVRAMLSGLILDRRGPAPAKSHTGGGTKEPIAAGPSPDRLNNNQILKQLRVALSLRADAVHHVILAGGGAMSVSEVGALFRNASARNFRLCGDQVLRQFLTGLTRQNRAPTPNVWVNSSSRK